MQYRREYIAGGVYFLTINLLDRNSQLLLQNIQHLKWSIKETQKTHPFELNAIVVLPEHFHMIITLPEKDSNFSIRIRKIKSLFSRQVSKNDVINNSRYKKRERGIWQRRFWEHLIRDDDDFEHHVNYIHYNPVKHGYVSKPVEWKYSSIHKFIKKGIITKGWACDHDFKETAFGE